MVAISNAVQAPALAQPAIEEIWAWLHKVCDPEIPALSVVDLGIVRGVEWNRETETCVVSITPTYSGCPASEIIQVSIREELERRGIPHVEVKLRLSPPWTTDWLSPGAREMLSHCGIAPPAGEIATSVLPVLRSAGSDQSPTCPHCGSNHTALISQFGSTLCKALYRCQQCREPFEYFKPR